MFCSSNISITNRLEQASLFFYNGSISTNFKEIKLIKPILETIEQQIFSRIAGLLISPAALLDIAIHSIILPFSVIYAIGKSIYIRKLDFILPWQHLQRIRDAVFPALFGSLFCFIHPYLGIYAAEPSKKHIAVGILVSGTENKDLNTACSPITSMNEVSTILSDVSENLKLDKREKKLFDQVAFWEEEFEKIQSIDFFNLNLTFKLSYKIQKAVDHFRLPFILKEIIKRVALVVYPLLALADLTVYAFASVISLSTLLIKVLGGQSPAYLEKAWSPEVLIYNIVKIPLFIISATIGLIVSLVHPKTGILCTQYTLQWMAKIPFLIKMLGIRLRIYFMGLEDKILLPVVQARPEDPDAKLNLLPSKNSHMLYLLVEKTAKNTYRAELIERGNDHGRTDFLNRKEMGKVIERVLGLRYKFGCGDVTVMGSFHDKTIIDLGTQGSLNNCVITNLFATLEVLRNNKNNFMDLCIEARRESMRRYNMYAFDFFPFGDTTTILSEVENSSNNKI